MDHKPDKSAMKSNKFVFFAAVLLLSTLTLEAQAHTPSLSDCLTNPFASGCRGISAKRSSPSYQDVASTRQQQSSSSSQWQQYNANRLHNQARSLYDLLLRSDLVNSAAFEQQQVVSRPIIGRFYLCEPPPTTNLLDEHASDLMHESHEEH